MAKILLQEKNALPFDAQRHCKLSLTDIQDIRERYENGEKINHIHLDYPQVSKTAIRYWVTEENREADLKRRKSNDSYIYADRENRDKEYLKDLAKRRKDNNLPIYNYIKLGNNNTIPLSKEEKEEIERLFEQGYSCINIQDKTGIKRTKIQSYFDNINYDWYRKQLNIRKTKRKQLLDLILNDKLNGLSREEIANKYNIEKSYVSNLLQQAGWRKNNK